VLTVLSPIVRNDGTCKCGVPVYGKFLISGCSVDGDVKEIYLAVCLLFCCEIQFLVHCVEVIQDVMDACVVGVIYDQYVIYISEVSCNLVFV